MNQQHRRCPRPGGTPCNEQVPAMAYVPVQELQEVYETDTGFSKGTIFPELDKPFMRARGCGRCD